MTGRPLVVLVDDEPQILELYGKLLGKWYEVRRFASSEELLAQLASLAPALLVLDWILPDLDGVGLCRRIREDRSIDSVPIALFTGVEPTLENVQTAFDAGAQIFLHKGDNPNVLVAQMRALVDLHERLAAHQRLQATLLSALRHDIANWLTGVVTGAQLLAMDPAPAGTERKVDLGHVISCSEHLRHLVDDLGEVLHPDLQRADPEPFLVKELLADLAGYLAWAKRPVRLPDPPPARIAGSRRRLGRALYYLVRTFEDRLPKGQEIDIVAYAMGGAVVLGVRARCGVQPPLAAAFESRALPAEELGPRVLPVEYAKGALRQHGTAPVIAENERETRVSFSIPAFGGS
ncbi:MAG: hybrid sensor histidine kinase/response regulator [Planctomycetes bacterium]|nr:hybrid sensor histidine kinase/response regulator [Planctomycetota bacterium]